MKTNKEIVCIICPNGCRMNVIIDEKNKVEKVENALCTNGRTYAQKEVQCPERSLTSTVKVIGGKLPLVSVRSERPIPKDKLMEAAAELRRLELIAPVEFHQIISDNLAGTGVKVISTKQVEKR